MFSAVFEATIQTIKLLQTYVLDRTATRIGLNIYYNYQQDPLG
jgi:hypothetical protein